MARDKTARKILCLGGAMQDIYLKDRDDFDEVELADGVSVFKSLKLGDKVDIDQVYYMTGGGGANASVSFARGGHKAYFVGRIGRDIVGESILEDLELEGVNVDFVGYACGVHTGCSVVLLSTRGERTILTCRAAAAKWAGLTTEALSSVKPDWLYVTTVRGEMDLLREYFGKASQYGVKIMWNPGVKELEQPATVRRLLQYVDILNVNRQEAELLLGKKGEPVDLVRGLSNAHDVSVIVTDGKYGAVGGDGDDIYRVGLYEDVKVVDTTGAGDAFGSGFLTSYARDGDWTRALTWGAANSTSVVQKIGSQTGILYKSVKLHKMDIEKLKMEEAK